MGFTYFNQDKLHKLIGLAIALSLILSACNPTRMAYKGIEKHEPKTQMDSSRLATRAKTTFPVKSSPVIKPGTPKPNKPDSSLYFKKAVELLKKQKQREIDSLRALKRDTTIIQSEYGLGFNTGYDAGYYKGKSECEPSTTTIDTIQQDSPETTFALNDLRIKKDLSDKAIIEANTKASIYKSQSAKKTWWMIGEGVAMLLLLFGLFKRKTKQAVAN